jgi:hypothetical protein
MSKISHRAKGRKVGVQPDLFSWSPPPAFVRTTDWAAQRIARRFHLSIEHAATVARLAGIGSEATR